jgi:hypothetical protein
MDALRATLPERAPLTAGSDSASEAVPSYPHRVGGSTTRRVSDDDATSASGAASNAAFAGGVVISSGGAEGAGRGSTGGGMEEFDVSALDEFRALHPRLSGAHGLASSSLGATTRSGAAAAAADQEDDGSEVCWGRGGELGCDLPLICTASALHRCVVLHRTTTRQSSRPGSKGRTRTAHCTTALTRRCPPPTRRPLRRRPHARCSCARVCCSRSPSNTLWAPAAARGFLNGTHCPINTSLRRSNRRSPSSKRLWAPASSSYPKVCNR